MEIRDKMCNQLIFKWSFFYIYVRFLIWITRIEQNIFLKLGKTINHDGFIFKSSKFCKENLLQKFIQTQELIISEMFPV